MLHSSEEEAELMLAHLSTDGVTSPLARETDPERESDYREGLRAFRERVKTLAKKARATKLKRGAIPRLRYPDLAVPPLNTLERMIAIIETNCHARDFSDAVMERYLHEDAQEEQWVGVWLCASMMDHSCANNATCDFEELVEELEDRHPTPFTMDTATLVVTAVRAIRAGDHVTINYNEVDGASREEQREALRRRGFECQCSKCANC